MWPIKLVGRCCWLLPTLVRQVDEAKERFLEGEEEGSVEPSEKRLLLPFARSTPRKLALPVSVRSRQECAKASQSEEPTLAETSQGSAGSCPKGRPCSHFSWLCPKTEYRWAGSAVMFKQWAGAGGETVLRPLTAPLGRLEETREPWF